MTTSSCDRIFYAVKRVMVAPCAAGGAVGTWANANGVQSIGFSGDIPLEEILQIGCIEIYDYVEGTPEVEVTMEKVLDGTCPIYIMATQGCATTPDLFGRSLCPGNVALGFYSGSDCAMQNTGTADSLYYFKDLYPSSLSYSFNIDGAFTESITLQGNNLLPSTVSGTPTPNGHSINTADTDEVADIVTNTALSAGLTESPAPVQRREHIIFTPPASVAGSTGTDINGYLTDPDATILPNIIQGISSSGTNPTVSGEFAACIQTITVSVDLPRENINCLGQKEIKCKYVDFPVEVTTEVEQIADGTAAYIGMIEGGIFLDASSPATGCASSPVNSQNSTIRIATCDGTRIYLGTKNRFQTVNHQGGDTGGGTATISYTFKNSSKMTMLHEACADEAAFWSNRLTYLTN